MAIHMRRPGVFKVMIYLGRGQDGHRFTKTVTVHGGRRDAEREERRLKQEFESGTLAQTNLTVRLYLESWLSECAKMRVTGKTYERYESIVRQHLMPALGHHKLAKLRPLHIQRCYAAALTGGRKDGKSGGLSEQTVLHHHRVLKSALNQAVRWQLIARNPAEAVQPPKPRWHEMNALDEAQTAQLLVAAKDSELWAPILVAVTTGLRRGELLALRWRDIDLEGQTLTVTQTVEQTAAQGVVLKQPKTAKSRRTIPLTSVAVDALHTHRSRQSVIRLRSGDQYHNLDLVFAGMSGDLWNPSTFSSSFSRLVERAGLKGVRFHDLRHSHATQLFRLGIHPKIVSERLGHATVSITLNTYSHVLPGMQDEAIAKYDAALKRAFSAAV